MIAHLDVGLSSENAGDHVITQAVSAQLAEFGSDEWVRVPTHSRPSLSQIRSLSRSARIVAGGSNLLASHMERHRQWLVSPDLVFAMRKRVVLCGVGWWQYQEDPCWYSRRVLRSILDPSAVHSVRDSYTALKLSRMGYQAINTGCPTMWGLETRSKPDSVGSTVVTTVTDYNRDPERDSRMLALLSDRYENVRLVAMAQADADYFNELDPRSNVVLAGIGLAGLDSELSAPVEYVGTRLHAGVRAMQMGRAAVVIAIDNRAREISKDTGLPIVLPSELTSEEVGVALELARSVDLRIPTESIEAWKRELSKNLS